MKETYLFRMLRVVVKYADRQSSQATLPVSLDIKPSSDPSIGVLS